VLHGARVVIGKFLSVVLIASVVGKRREFAILCNGKIQFMKKKKPYVLLLPVVYLTPARKQYILTKPQPWVYP